MDTTWSSQLLVGLWKTSLQAAILAGVVWLVCRSAKQAPARFRHALWVLVVAKFITPPLAQFPSQMAFWAEPRQISPVTRMSAYTPEVSAPKLDRASAPAVHPVPQTAPKPVSGLTLPTLAQTAAGVWILGSLTMLMILAARGRRQSRLLRSLTPGDERVQALLAKAVGALDMRRMPRLAVSEHTCTPALLGLIRPTIVLPPQVTASCTDEEITAMLLHELAHIKRRDMLVMWIYEVVRAVFFFHPAIWLAGRELETERELACDELVVSASLISPTDYAAGYVAALKLAQRGSAMQASIGMAEPFEVGKRRLEMILRTNTPRLTAGWLVALGVIAAVGLPTFARVSEPPLSGSDKQLAILAGLVPMEGPGVLVTLVDSPKYDGNADLDSYLVRDTDIESVVDELLSAGAETVSVNGHRWGAMSAIGSKGPVILLDGNRLTAPFKISAIGDPGRLEAALKSAEYNMPDLILLEMVDIKKADRVEVPALSSSSGNAAALAGTTPVTGPGLRVTLTDSPQLSPTETDPNIVEEYLVHDTDIRNVVNELKAIGATAISVNGQRWIANSTARSNGAAISVNGVRLSPPYTIEAAGKLDTASSALADPKGPLSDLVLLKMVSVKKLAKVTVPPYIEQKPLARPINTTTERPAATPHNHQADWPLHVRLPGDLDPAKAMVLVGQYGNGLALSEADGRAAPNDFNSRLADTTTKVKLLIHYPGYKLVGMEIDRANISADKPVMPRFEKLPTVQVAVRIFQKDGKPLANQAIQVKQHVPEMDYFGYADGMVFYPNAHPIASGKTNSDGRVSLRLPQLLDDPILMKHSRMAGYTLIIADPPSNRQPIGLGQIPAQRSYAEPVTLRVR